MSAKAAPEGATPTADASRLAANDTAFLRGLFDAHEGDSAAVAVDWLAVKREADAQLARDLAAARAWEPARRVPEGTPTMTAAAYDAALERMKPKPALGAVRRWRDGATRGRNYALAALQGEARCVASAGHGVRNISLNASAWTLGRLVIEGVLTAAEVERVLVAAARDAGLSDLEACSTVRGALRRRGAR